MTHSNKPKTLRNLAALAVIAGPMTAAMATNGMLMEGYGPISTSMGGVSQAIDHGTAGMAQNPATLGMMADGTSTLDVALGVLGPDVRSSMVGMGEAKSGGTSYIMPALGYVKRQGAYTYGFGVFAQGGMGTEYDSTSFLGMGSGIAPRSELGVGNVIFPVAYQVNSNLTVGATLKFMWSSLDMRMAASGAQLAGMAQASGIAPTGNLATALPSLAGASWAGLSFSDDSKFSGAAKSTGFGASIGATYKASNDVTMGASYQFKSALNDMTTASSDATMSAQGGFIDHGKITVIDFQMPSVVAIGAGWQMSPSLLLAADIKSIGWADSMKSFKMRYDSAGMGGSVNFAMPQNWRDQTVLNLGAAWKANEKLTLRGGVSLADNPIPDDYVNPLFPAIVKSHVMFGMGYKVSGAGNFNASLTYAPEVKVSTTASPIVTIAHAQTNLQLMYTHSF